MQHVWVCKAAPVHIMRHSNTPSFVAILLDNILVHFVLHVLCSVALSLLLLNLFLVWTGLSYIPTCLCHPRGINLLLYHLLTIFILKTKFCEPSAYPTSAKLEVAGNETGYRRRFPHPLGRLICLLHKDHVGFSYRAATDWQVLLWHRNITHPGIGFETSFVSSLKGHKHKTSWGLCSVEPSI